MDGIRTSWYIIRPGDLLRMHKGSIGAGDGKDDH